MLVFFFFTRYPKNQKAGIWSFSEKSGYILRNRAKGKAFYHTGERRSHK